MEIRTITGKFDDGRETRTVEIQDVNGGGVFVRPTDYDPRKDPQHYRHGFITDVRHIHSVSVLYADGAKTFFGDPPVNKLIAVNLVAKNRTKVLADE
jgi:hypothetical protein